MKNNFKFGVYSVVFILLVFCGGKVFGQSVTVVTDQSTTICAGTVVTFTATTTSCPNNIDSCLWIRVDAQNKKDSLKQPITTVSNTASSVYSIASITNGMKISCKVFRSNSVLCNFISTSSPIVFSVISTTLTLTDPIYYGQSKTICEGTTNTFSVTPVSGATSYTWVLPSGWSGSSTTNSIAVTTSTISGNVSVTATNACGASNTLTVPITIKLKPATPGAISGPSSICALTTNTYSVTPVLGVDYYTWTMNGSWSGSSSTNFIDVTIDALSATLGDIIVSASNVCGKISNSTITVTVNPTPVIPSQTASICSGTAFTVSLSGSTIIPSGTTYTWLSPLYSGNAGELTGGTSQTNRPTVSEMLNNQTNITQTATYTVTPKAGTCEGDTFTTTVSVNPIPSIPTQNVTICSGQTFSVTPSNGSAAIVPLGTTYKWLAPTYSGSLSGGSAQSNKTAISQSLTNASNIAQTATYTVTPTSGASGACMGSTFIVLVTVSPVPSISVPFATICSGVTFTVSPSDGGNNNNNNIVPVGTSYTWALPQSTVASDILGGVTGTNQSIIIQTLVNTTSTFKGATYTIIPTSGSCSGTAFKITNRINPAPYVPVQSTTVCSGEVFTVNPKDGSGGAIVPSGTMYTWLAPIVTGGITGGSAQFTQVASVSQTLTNPTNTLQTATYTVTPITGTVGACNGAAFIVTVNVHPKPYVASTVTTTVCSGQQFDATPLSTGGNIIPGGTTYTWLAPTTTGSITGGSLQAFQLGISQVLSNTSNTAKAATYAVTPQTVTCSGNIFNVIVTVNATPHLANKSVTVCSGTTIAINPSNGVGNIVPFGTTYTWALPTVTGGITGGTADTNNPNLSFTLINPTLQINTATYTVVPTSPLGLCKGTAFTVIDTVYPKPLNASLIDLTNFPSNKVTSNLCIGSNNISFNVEQPVIGCTYLWSASPSNLVLIKKDSTPNTVVSFSVSATAYDALVSVRSAYPLTIGGCTSNATVSTYTINVGAGYAINEAKIKLKQPGNLLWYTDNTTSGYKWGYDSVIDKKPYFVDDQVYQVFVPKAQFLTSGNSPLLDTTHFWYWVMVYYNQGTEICKSKIYYNGPFSSKSSVEVDEVPTSISASIAPNPNNGNFYVTLQGNIFGDVQATIINMLGEPIYESTIQKSMGIQSYPISVSQLVKGIYTLQLNGSNNEHVSVKLIIAE